MADRFEVVWVVPPLRLVEALAVYQGKLIVAVRAVADLIAVKLQNESRSNAPWEDRTGNARSGLFAETVAEAAGAVVTVYLSHGHTVYYGQFLELAHGQKYAIIWPTITANLGEIKSLLDGIFA